MKSEAAPTMNERIKAAMEEAAALRETEGLEKGNKKYLMVKTRIELFRKHFPECGIDTNVVAPEGVDRGRPVYAVAKVTSATGQVIASGNAMVVVGSSEFASTSPVETAETAAIGRALACLGLAGGEYPSADEMGKVEERVTARPSTPPRMQEELHPFMYVPKAPFAVKTDLFEETKKVVDAIVHIRKREQLSRYWHMLSEFIEALTQNDPQLLGELKAAFSVANRQASE